MPKYIQFLSDGSEAMYLPPEMQRPGQKTPAHQEGQKLRWTKTRMPESLRFPRPDFYMRHEDISKLLSNNLAVIITKDA